MKRFISALVAVLMLLSLSACDDEQTPFEKCRDKAISIGEQYLDFELTAEEAKEQLESLKVPETDLEYGQLSLEIDIGYLCYLLGKKDTTYEEIEEQVEDLKTSILLYE